MNIDWNRKKFQFHLSNVLLLILATLTAMFFVYRWADNAEAFELITIIALFNVSSITILEWLKNTFNPNVLLSDYRFYLLKIASLYAIFAVITVVPSIEPFMGIEDQVSTTLFLLLVIISTDVLTTSYFTKFNIQNSE